MQDLNRQQPLLSSAQDALAPALAGVQQQLQRWNTQLTGGLQAAVQQWAAHSQQHVQQLQQRRQQRQQFWGAPLAVRAALGCCDLTGCIHSPA
jgi:hypothetical protein